MRVRLLAAVMLVGCASHHHHNGDAGADATPIADACSGLSCFIADCGSKTDPNGNPLPPTSISGTVYAPNGTLPLYGVDALVATLGEALDQLRVQLENLRDQP